MRASVGRTSPLGQARPGELTPGALAVGPGPCQAVKEFSLDKAGAGEGLMFHG